MPRLPSILVAAALWPAAAAAGEAPCWYEAGVLVASAEVMGVAGDYVLDTGSPRTLLHDTQAQGAGYAETELLGAVRLAGLTLPDRAVKVEALDARFRGLPTPVAGVIGADLLAGLVLDVRFSPCRVALHPPAAAPAFGPARRLQMILEGGRPAVLAAVSDGRRTLAGAFAVATGSNAAVRLRADLAGAPGAAEVALLPYGDRRARLRALSFAGDLQENRPAGLLPADGSAVAGEIGAPALSAYRLRFDFAGGLLHLTKEKGPPDRSDGP